MVGSDHKGREWLRAERARRLRMARDDAGFRSASAAMRNMGLSTSTYRSHENESRTFDFETARKYARFFRVDPLWLWVSTDEYGGEAAVPIVGYVGAGAIVHTVSGEEGDAYLGQAERPPDVEGGAVAVIVRGNSMRPAYNDGDTVYYTEEPGSPREYINRECVVRLADGTTLIKQIIPGSDPDKFTLISHNSPPMINAAVDWATPIRWVRKA